MNDNPYQVSHAEVGQSTESRNGTSLMFWFGVVLLIGAVAGVAIGINGMNSVWAQISSPQPAPLNPAKLAAKFSSYRLLSILSIIVSVPALLIVIIAFRRQSRLA